MKKLVPFAIALIPVSIIGVEAFWNFQIERYIYSWLTIPEARSQHPAIIIKMLLYVAAMLFLIGTSVIYFCTPDPKLKDATVYTLRTALFPLTLCNISAVIINFHLDNLTWDNMNGYVAIIRTGVQMISVYILWKEAPSGNIPRINVSAYPLYEESGKRERLIHHTADMLYFYGITDFWVIYLLSDPNHIQKIFHIPGMIIVYFLYFFLAEALLGQTPGQSLTNSCPVGLRSPMSFRKALLRSLSRLIPFDRFSFLWGKNWHDRLSGTTVARRNSWKDIPFEGERL